MIYITGDTHGLIDFPKLRRYFSRRYASSKDVLIILGDAGIVWSESDCSIDQYEYLGPTVVFLDGNHENFTLLNQFPVVEVFGAKAHFLADRVYHVLRGEILRINGKSFLCLGGATSIDKSRRVPGVSWWEDEHIRNEDIDNALNNVLAIGGSVDYVLTHCAPSSIVNSMFRYNGDADTKQLDKLRSHFAYDHWYFGHYHEDKKAGRFRCFYNDILEIPIMNKGKRPVHQRELFHNDEGNSPYLINRKTLRRTGLTEADLPEWFYKHYARGYRFYDLSGVTDVAYEGAPFPNHISKDSSIYLSYDGTHPKDKDHQPKNRHEWEVWTWRADIVSIILGLEKYSPGLKLDPIKAQINLTYDQYNNHEGNYDGYSMPCRPFPEVETPPFHDRWKKGIAQYQVTHGTRILGTFIKVETAIAFAETFVTHDLNYAVFHREDSAEGPYHRTYQIGHNPDEWVHIRTIDK